MARKLSLSDAVVLEVVGIEKIQKTVKILAGLSKQRAVKEVSRAALRIRNQAIRNVATDTGDLKKRIGIERLDEGLTQLIGEQKGAAEHGIWVELGTDPHFPPVDPIFEWVKRQGLDLAGATGGNKAKRQRALAFLIARSISEFGTEAQPFLVPAWADEVKTFENTLIKAMREELRRV